MVEDIVEKRQIYGYNYFLHHEQFLLFPECFQKACFPGASKGVIVWEWVKLKRNEKITLKLSQLFQDVFFSTRLIIDWTKNTGS